jgi:5-methylcytosine-specific restriction protein B
MDTFTWISAYTEIATKLRAYKDRQQELIKILSDLRALGLPIIALTDKNTKNEQIPLTEIDPFTFFANFNRGIKTENRIAIIRALKEVLGLASEVPTDFTGTPVVSNQKAWFFAYQEDRGDQDIHLLWDLFGQALDNNISPQTFDAVLKIRFVSYNITMGLFWINPEQFLSLDSVNRKYLTKHGIPVTGLPDYETYVEYMRRTRSELQKPFYEISHGAWLDDQTPVTVTQEPHSGAKRRSTCSFRNCSVRGGAVSSPRQTCRAKSTWQSTPCLT